MIRNTTRERKHFAAQVMVCESASADYRDPVNSRHRKRCKLALKVTEYDCSGATLGLKQRNTILRFWIGSHAEYDRLLKQL